jgi:hypothetical protein
MENPASYKVGYRAIIKELLIPKNCGIHITKIMIIRKKRFYLANQMSFMSSINIERELKSSRRSWQCFSRRTGYIPFSVWIPVKFWYPI